MGSDMREVTPDRGKNLYDLLEVSPNASPPVIQAAYHALARAWHPDVNPAPEAARRIRDLNAAYHVLSHPQLRAGYDLQRARLTRRDRVGGSPTGPSDTLGRPAHPTILVPRAETTARLERLVPERGGQAYIGRLPVYTGQAFLVLATIAVLVGAVLLLLWIGMSIGEEMSLERGPFIEITTT